MAASPLPPLYLPAGRQGSHLRLTQRRCRIGAAAGSGGALDPGARVSVWGVGYSSFDEILPRISDRGVTWFRRFAQCSGLYGLWWLPASGHPHSEFRSVAPFHHVRLDHLSPTRGQNSLVPVLFQAFLLFAIFSSIHLFHQNRIVSWLTSIPRS